MNNVQYGRSMVEMIGVLAVIAVLSVGGIVGYSQAMARHRINRTIDEVSRLVNAIHTMYLTQTTYAGIGQGNAQMTLAIAKKIASTAGFNPSGVNDAFGGGWRVFDAHPNSNSNGQYSYPQSERGTAFVVAFMGVPEEACLELATVNWASTGDGLIGFGVANRDSSYAAVSATKKDCPKGGIVKIGTTGYFACAQDLPLKPEDAITVCSGSTSNSYTFSFKYK